MRHVYSLAAALALNAATVYADEALPSLTFQADPSGKGAKLKAGFDVRHGVPIDMIISPFVEGSTDNGTADLFVLDSKGISTSSNWSIGAVISFLRWPGVTANDQAAVGNTPAYRTLAFSAFQACSKLCDDPDTKPRAGTFCQKRDEVRHDLREYATRYPDIDPVFSNQLRDAKDAEQAADNADAAVTTTTGADRPSAVQRAKDLRAVAKARRAAANQLLDERASGGISIDDICLNERPALDSYLQVHYDAWSAVPTRVLQVGLSAGATMNKYLDPSVADELTLRKRTHSTQAVGVMAVYTIPHWALEAPLVLRRKFKLATTDTAKWCVSAGEVVDDHGVAWPAQTCDEQPVGPLRGHYSIDVAGFLSRLSPSNFWRLGFGPQLSFSPKADGESASSYRAGGAMQLYIGTNLIKRDLKGLVRLSLGAFTSRTATGKTDRALTVNLAILSTTTLFPSVFDEF